MATAEFSKFAGILSAALSHEGFPPPPDKDLESPSSTRLEALVPSRDSTAMTRSPSPLENPRDGEAWWAAIYGVAQSRTRLKRLSQGPWDPDSLRPALRLGGHTGRFSRPRATSSWSFKASEASSHVAIVPGPVLQGLSCRFAPTRCSYHLDLFSLAEDAAKELGFPAPGNSPRLAPGCLPCTLRQTEAPPDRKSVV